MAFQDWLEDPMAIRGVFVEATVSQSGSDVVKYLSNIGMLTKDSSVSFLPIITGGVKFSENISVGGDATMSFGDLEINNPSGEYDEWLDPDLYIWVNKPIKIWVGDPRWLVSTWSTTAATVAAMGFELVFDGIIADIDSKSENTLNIKVRDKLERLNYPITETKLGTSYGAWGSGRTNDDKIVPLVFGEVHNMEPMLVDPAWLEYTFGNYKSKHLLEVRDMGVPIYTDDTSAVGPFSMLTGLEGGSAVSMGSTAGYPTSMALFRLKHPAVGQITISVLGTVGAINYSTGVYSDATYTNTIAGIIGTIVTQFGKVGKRFTTADIDITNFNSFNTAVPYPVGIVISGTENVLSVCNDLAKSVGASVTVTRKGMLQLLRITPWTNEAFTYIDSNDIIANSLSISNRTVVTSSTKLNYCKNWTVQSNLAASLPDEHRTMYAEEWLSTTVEDTNVKTAYGLSIEPTNYDTMLLVKADADAEAARLNNMFKKPVTTYKFTLGRRLMDLKLGSYIHLTYRRFGLQDGVKAQIVSLAPNWLNMTVDIEVIV